MSDLMLYGVLRMPYEMAMSNELSRFQFYGRVQEVVDRMERAEKRVEELEAARATQPASAPADPTPIHDQTARWAIDGAILKGRVGEAAPPTNAHWLYEYWRIGQQLVKLRETSSWDNVTPADDAQAAVGAPQGQADPVEKEYELHQDDMMVAGAYGDTAWQQIQHYAAMYSRDGPVEIYEVTRRKISKPAQPSAAATDGGSTK